MKPRTLDSASAPDGESTTATTVEPSATRGRTPLVAIYFGDSLEFVAEKPYTASEMIEVDQRELLGQPFMERLSFDGGREIPFNVRSYFMARYQQSFADIPAFGIWADRKESDDELLERLGSQWGGGELE